MLPPYSILEAVLERITYANEETGYTVARVSPSNRAGTTGAAESRGGAGGTGGDLLTVVGNLLGAQPGESLRLTGRWKSHPQYGRQFEAQSFTTVLPATIQGIRRYLGSGLIKGIGPRMAERIVAHFDVDTLRIIEDEPTRLIEVPGLGPKRTALITRAWEEQKAIKEVMVFLQGVGVSTTIHRLLALQPGGDPKYGPDNPLPAELVVVDETSMIDVILANKLVRAIPRGAHVLLGVPPR